MKPKTSYQKKIAELNCSVPPLAGNIIDWAKEHSLNHPAVRRRNNVTTCAMCGNTMVYAGDARNVVCLECGRHLQVLESDTWKSIRGQIKGWFSALSVVDGIQLQRTFEIRCRYFLDKRPHSYFIRELCRHWLSPQGELAVTALPRMMGQFLDCFPLAGKIELRGSSQMVYDYIADNASLFPEISLIPALQPNVDADLLFSKGTQTALRKSLSDTH